MKVVLKKDTALSYKKGTEIDLSDELAEVLIKKGAAEKVKKSKTPKSKFVSNEQKDKSSS